MSRDKKRQMIWYQVDDTGAIARHLEKMAAKGWLLESVDNWWYIYHRAEPARVKYAVAFFPEASVFDPGLTEGQETYIDYCRAAGWELAAAYGPIQYFRSARPDPVPIETDEAVKLAAIRRTMRKTSVLSYALLLALPVISLPVFWSIFRRDLMELFSNDRQLGVIVLMLAILLYGCGMLLDYLIWVLRSKRSVAKGGACRRPHTRFRLLASIAMMAVCGAVVLSFFVDAGTSGLWPALAFYLILYSGVMLLGRWVLRKLKSRGTSRENTKGIFFAFAIGAGIAVGFLTPLLFGGLANAGIIRAIREPAESYTYSNGNFSFTRGIYRDDLPLTLEDLGCAVTEEDHCSYKAEIDRSFLAVRGEYTQAAMNLDSDLPWLYYQIYETKWPWLLEKCWEALTAAEEEDSWPVQPLLPAPWGAAEAYKQEELTSYFLLYPDRIITFRLSEDASPQQLDTIVRTLQP